MGDPRHSDRDVFAEAKRVACGPIAEAAGAELRRSGPRLIGSCPLCGGDKRSTRFQITLRSNLWICRGCGEGGSSVDLEMALAGGDALDAAKRLAGDDSAARVDGRAKPDAGARTSSTAPMALRLWREARAAATAPAKAWFASRGIDPGLIDVPLTRLRFHPDAFLAGERKAAGNGWAWIKTAPAIIAPIIDTNANGKLIGVHATYLSRDGGAKADIRAPNGDEIPSRKMWGRTAGGVCPLTEIRRGIDEETPLFVGEGLETTLSAYAYWAARGQHVRAAAVLSLDNLQGHWLKDDDGCATCWPPRADSARPPWTMGRAGNVVIIADRDMSAIYVKRRDEMGCPKRMRLDGEARAQLCGDLAAQAWRAAGATSVAVALPARLGADLNDMMKETT